MWRKALSLVVIVLSVLTLWQFVAIPYRCNIVKGEAKRSFARGKATGDAFQVRVAALRNLPSLSECLRKQPRDPDLAGILGEHLIAVGRAHAARDVYCGALAYTRTPLLYLACANASLAVGDERSALQNLIVVGEFAGPDALSSVPDAEVRWKATRRAGVLFEKNAIARGELVFRNLAANGRFHPADGKSMYPYESSADSWNLYPSAPLVWTKLLPASGRHGRPALAVETSSANAGVRQILLPTAQRPRIIATAWVFVERGTVCFGASDAQSLLTTVCSTKIRVWEKLESVNVSCPAVAISLLAGSEDGARFLVDEVTARHTLAAPLCER